MLITLIIAAALPSLVLIGYVCFKDRLSPEPPKMLLKAFFFGILSTVVSLTMSVPASLFGLYPTEPVTVGGHIAVALFGAALPEELAKLFMLWLVLRRNKYFDESFDGIVYAVCVGMGFAFAENIGYLAQAGEYWVNLGITRGLISVPGHYAFAVAMGFYYSCYHFGGRRLLNGILMIALPVALHAIFDAILMVSSASEHVGISAILTLMFFVFFFIMQRYAQKRLKRLTGK